MLSPSRGQMLYPRSAHNNGTNPKNTFSETVQVEVDSIIYAAERFLSGLRKDSNARTESTPEVWK